MGRDLQLDAVAGPERQRWMQAGGAPSCNEDGGEGVGAKVALPIFGEVFDAQGQVRCGEHGPERRPILAAQELSGQ